MLGTLKVEINFIAGLFKSFHCRLGAFGVGIFNVEPLILKYSTLLSLHRVLHERNSLTGNKVVT